MFEIIQILIILIGIAAVVYFSKVYKSSKRVDATDIPSTETIRKVLKEDISFYQELNSQEQKQFEDRIKYFLERIKITAVKSADVRDADRVMVAAGAVIPLFRFQNWFYNNLNEVLIYPDSFSSDFALKGEDRNVVGMVGDGTMNRTMILSLAYLRAGFLQNTSGNTAIHEFVHLIDKSDGATDGVPEEIIPHDSVKPWLKMVHEYIKEIRERDFTDINPYGATNEAEFLAVVSEYFFQKPEELRTKHPDLYSMLEKGFGKPPGLL